MNKNYKMIFLKETDSTNSFIKRNGDIIKKNVVVVAEHQTCGRGRMDRSFISQSGESLLLSLKVKNNGNMPSAVTLMAGLAVLKALQKIFPSEYEIKWPNDILLAYKKICGILCEGIGDYVIIGIGVNLYEEPSYFLENDLLFASSVYAELGVKIEKQELTEHILDEFEKTKRIFEKQGFSAFRKEYSEFSANIGKNVIIKSAFSEREGKAIDINEQGELIVLIDGKTEAIRSGEVSIRYDGMAN